MQEHALWRCSADPPWFPEAERDQTGLADRRAPVLYTGVLRRSEKTLGKNQNYHILHIWNLKEQFYMTNLQCFLCC
jgi:hypothetical protein